MRSTWLVNGTLLLLAAACVPSEPPVVRPQQPPAVDLPPVLERPAPVPERGLYSAEEALRDVLSGELEYIGTGRWPSVERSRACAFRNQRVVVVNAYCTLYEPNAFRIAVYSPERGRVNIYAEADGAVSARPRAAYFTFTVEGGPPPGPEAGLPALSLTMPYEALRRYEQQRYEAFLPGCYGGKRHQREERGCMGALAAREREWAAKNDAFLAHANDDWYRVVRQIRALATRYGENPK